MKKKLLICLACIIAIICLSCCAAIAESKLIYSGKALENEPLNGPGELTFSITVSNDGDEDMPGPVKLYYPDMTPVEEFGSPTLAAGNSKSWEGTWNVTQKELESGFVGFIVERTEVDAETGELTTKMARLKLPITYAEVQPQLTIKRSFFPKMPQKNQEVRVIYEITNNSRSKGICTDRACSRFCTSFGKFGGRHMRSDIIQLLMKGVEHMPTKECQLRASAKYKRENMKPVKFEINKSTEAELLAWIESKQNKQGYIKSLILADMEAHKQST